ncbi:hypothetical protein LAZ29_03170 [Cereibacter sphaeroides]|uniref:hypothetical protein n=1 Tax=Cereibacter sphaeroides TaxID=1063 RepID=UPI001F43AF80|nr:hypothetical protein [Cereibacter sphaeroides]MCE6949925.1 hypothetical protein [Cereibacter sphaeroides]
MIELVIAACLAGSDCREFRHLYDPYEVSVMTCMIAGQPEVVRWQQRNPGWQVRRWSCGWQDRRASNI